MNNINGPLKVGIGGGIGTGKTSLTEALCKSLSKTVSMAVISNDIYTTEDAEYLMRVPYRFNKEFKQKVKIKNRNKKWCWAYSKLKSTV